MLAGRRARPCLTMRLSSTRHMPASEPTISRPSSVYGIRAAGAGRCGPCRPPTQRPSAWRRARPGRPTAPSPRCSRRRAPGARACIARRRVRPGLGDQQRLGHRARRGRRGPAPRRRCRARAESEPPGWMIGFTSSPCSPKASAAMRISWLFIQLTLPFSVLISPLWASMRNGWASRHSREGVGRIALVDRSRRRRRSARPSGRDRTRRCCSARNMPL